ncbi:TPA: hypothetical protein DDW35_10760 [Candidatus Sumerlaeota bacterium]|nr:hypothetical protein [Candidatus Sumerlaeota bacterium]
MFFTLVVLWLASSCFAMVTISDKGTWPDTWPQELERYRDQAKSFGIGTGSQEDMHQIAFQSSKDFEQAWPYILKLKSKGAPITLELTSATYAYGVAPITAGVRIFCPARITPSGIPPWVNDIQQTSETLPEYVMQKNNQWVPWDGTWEKGFRYRARTEIELVVDGEIVNLNRISLPPDTPIIDNRFNGKSRRVERLASDKGSGSPTSLLVNEASKMQAAYMTTGRFPGTSKSSDEIIPERYWPDSIHALKPIRVYMHLSNIVVVQREGNGVEEGKYIPLLISSSLPGPGSDGFTLTQSEVGDGSMDFKRALKEVSK